MQNTATLPARTRHGTVILHLNDCTHLDSTLHSFPHQNTKFVMASPGSFNIPYCPRWSMTHYSWPTTHYSSPMPHYSCHMTHVLISTSHGLPPSPHPLGFMANAQILHGYHNHCFTTYLPLPTNCLSHFTSPTLHHTFTC